MKRCTWILAALLFCALSFPLPMASSLHSDAQNAFAVQKDETLNQDPAVTTKTTKKKKKKANAVQKDAAQQDLVKKDTGKRSTAKKAPARMSRKMKKQQEPVEPAAPN